MCQFLSAIVTRQGDLLCNPFLDSHEDLIDYFNLKDDTLIEKFVRVEFTPKDEDYFDVDGYSLRVDEKHTPDWFAEFEPRIKEELKTKIRNMIVDKAENKVLCGGVFIVRDSKILWTRYTKIITLKSSQVNAMWGNSQVNEMRDNSQVNAMWGNSQVNEMRDNSQVNAMWDNSQVNVMRDNSQVNVMRDNSQVNAMWENSKAEKAPKNDYRRV